MIGGRLCLIGFRPERGGLRKGAKARKHGKIAKQKFSATVG
jgi:hypothetical protein